MKISSNEAQTKNDIKKVLKWINPRVENGSLVFGDKVQTNFSINHRLINILFYLNDPEYIKLACDVIALRARMCIFGAMSALRAYTEYYDRIPDASRQILMEEFEKVLKSKEYLQPTLDFIGVNDNFPCFATYTSYMLGKMFNDKEHTEAAKRRLHQLEALLKRRGVISEYNSNTYTPHQLYILSSLEKIMCEEDLITIVKNAQQRIWFDYAAHINIKTGTCSGPHSRAYILTGDKNSDIKPFVYKLLFPELGIEEITGDMYDGMTLCCHLTEEYEVDDDIVDLFKNKQYPFEFKATTEYSASTDATPEEAHRDIKIDENIYEYPAGEAGIYTYQTEYYNLGYATGMWHNGVQTISAKLDYKRKDKDEFTDGRRCAYFRYLLNDEEKADQRFFDNGRSLAFGDKNKLVVLYKPKVSTLEAKHDDSIFDTLAAIYRSQEISGNKGVTSAKLVFHIPFRNIPFDKILLGDDDVSSMSAISDSAKSIYIKDGDVYIAIHPLCITDLGRENVIEIKNRNGVFEVAFYNYKGQAKDFAKREFILARNGAVMSVSSKEEIGSFEAFVEKEKKVLIEEEYFYSMHTRQTYVRQVTVNHPDVKLSCEYSPASEGIKNIAKNDYMITFPKLYATGFDVKKLPYCEDLN